MSFWFYISVTAKGKKWHFLGNFAFLIFWNTKCMIVINNEDQRRVKIELNKTHSHQLSPVYLFLIKWHFIKWYCIVIKYGDYRELVSDYINMARLDTMGKFNIHEPRLTWIINNQMFIFWVHCNQYKYKYEEISMSLILRFMRLSYLASNMRVTHSLGFKLSPLSKLRLIPVNMLIL